MNRKLNLANAILSVLIGLTLLFSAVQPVSVSASNVQVEGGVQRSVHPQTGKLSFLGTDPTNPLRVERAMERGLAPESRAGANLEMYAREFGIRDVGRELRVMRSSNVDDRLMVKYQQVYNDIPVVAGELIVNMKGNGGLLSINGEVSPDMSLDTQPKLSAEDARQRALALISQTYALAEAELTVSEPELWIFDERLIQDKATQPVHLVWRMEVASENAPLRELVLVNAQNGKISLHFNQVDTSWTGNPLPAREDAVNPEAVPAAEPVHAPVAGANMPLGDADPSLSLFVASTGTDDNGNNTCADFANPCATINHAISRAADGQTIGVAEGTYTGSGTEVVRINKSVNLSGGWNADYSAQTGYSTIDGQNARRGVSARQDGSISASLDHFKIINGYSLEGGGGVSSIVTLTIKNSIIAYNSSPVGGGGIFVSTAPLTLVNTSVHSNSGGGIYIASNNPDKPTLVQNSTISHNKGSGIVIKFIGKIVVANSTISNNQGVGIVENQPDNTVTILRNSIVAGNITSLDGPDCNGSLISQGYNILGKTASCDIKATTGDQFNIDPKLGAFLPMLGYHPLRPNSPAINHGNSATCPATDQRGVPRDKCDIGAYEYTIPGPASQVLLFNGDDQNVGPGKRFTPLAIAAVDAIGSPVPGVAVTFTLPTSGASAVFDTTHTNTMSTVTNAVGIASSLGLVANSENGEFSAEAMSDSLGLITFHLRIETWYLSAGGNDANDCRAPSTPCATFKGMFLKDDFLDSRVVWVTNDTFDLGPYPYTLTKSIEFWGGWDPTFTNRIGSTNLLGGFDVQDGAVIAIDKFVMAPSTGYLLPIRVGLNVDDSTLIVSNSIIQNFTLGIDAWNSNTIVSNSAIINNSGTSMGGGIYNSDGMLTIVNSTISGNGDPNITVGGGVHTFNSVVNIYSTTIARNSGKQAGGIYALGTVALANTLVVGNRASSGAKYGPDCSGVLVSRGSNLIGNLGLPGVSGDYPCRGDWTRSDILGDNAKPILDQNTLSTTLTLDPTTGQYYHPLKVGSLAIDGGNTAYPGGEGNACPSTDQLGKLRPMGLYCDIGASEYEFPSHPPFPLLVTYSALNTTLLTKSLICQGDDATCGSDKDVHAVRAHLYAFSAYQWYQNWHGRNSIDGAGMQINSSVRFGSQYQNAFWNGNMLVYGDGYGFPLADDVVAHELTHGVTQYESNLFYWYQSGAISESFSDLWGEAIDQVNGLGTDTPAVKWLIGENVSGLGAVRSMANPTKFEDPDSMTSYFYCDRGECLDDNGGVHTNSGVNNKAVFLLVQGGTFNGRTIRPLDWEKTLAIYYETQTNLLTSGSDYLDLYNALYQACLNKKGGTEGIEFSDCLEIRKATVAVRMNSQPATNFNPDVSLCPAGSAPISPDIFSEDFESGTDGWTFDAMDSEIVWGLSGEYARNGAYSIRADDSVGFVNSFAASQGIALPAGVKPFLHFSHSYSFETASGIYYDGGILEYSIDSGITWSNAGPLFSGGDDYSGTITDDYGNPLGPNRGFVGDSHGYVDSRYDLTSLAGKTVRFRWRIGTDQVYSVLGWAVDDIRIYTCVVVPSRPTLLSPANGSTVTVLRPLLKWSASTPDLHHYELQIATNSTFTENLAKYDSITTTYSRPTTNLANGKTYYWRVRAFNAAGKASAWSTVWSFTTP